jgi:deazaflavin-dependent oxidoreductase (nitroreductase family)
VDRRQIARRLLPIQNRVFNWALRWAIERGLAPPTYALLETVGRRSGRPRRVPVANGLEGDTFWLIAALGNDAAYVKNLRANPRVRITARPARLCDGVRVRTRVGVARPLPQEDARGRYRCLGKGRPGYRLDGLLLRALATDMLTIRIDLENGCETPSGSRTS